MLQWGNSDPGTYVILRKGTDIDRFNSKIKDFIKSKDKKFGEGIVCEKILRRVSLRPI